MGFIYCPSCGQQVSDQAVRCPNCGAALNGNPYQNQVNNNYGQQPYYPPKKSSNTLLYVIIGLLFGLLVGGLAFYFINQNAKNQKAISQMKHQQRMLEQKNKNLESEVGEAKKEAAEAKQQKVVVKQGAVHGAEHRAVSAGGRAPKVVVNGNGVRLRFAPSLNAGYLTWANGTTRSVPKYTRLQYGGWENGDWYKVIYQGIEFYISKEYSYLEY